LKKIDVTEGTLEKDINEFEKIKNSDKNIN
jgi:hypothetical protein